MTVMRRTCTVFAGLMAGLVLSGTARAGTADAILPPQLPWQGKSLALIAGADDPWRTPVEMSGFESTPDYDQTFAFLQRLEKTSPLIRLLTYGRTPDGRAMTAVIVTSVPGLKTAAITSDFLHTNGRSVVFAQAGIHAGEIDGKDAGLMLLRDIAVKGRADLVQGTSFVFVPIFNADGHDRSSPFNRPNQRGPENQGWRTTARNLNLNRDYAKLDSPEMRAQVELVRRLDPDLVFDLHVTDGIDYQYDITFGFGGSDGTFSRSPTAAAWLDRVFRPRIDRALTDAGHVPGPLIFARDDRRPLGGLLASITGPKFSDGYGDVTHRPTVLVENHSLKSYRRRVLGTYVLLAETLKLFAEDGASLRNATAADKKLRPPRVPIEVAVEPVPSRRMTFLGIAHETFPSVVTGRDEIRWLGTPETIKDLPIYVDIPTRVISRPRAYWVPPAYSDLIDRLISHGIKVEVQKSAIRQPLTMARLTDSLPAVKPYEGHYILEHPKVTTATLERTWPPGSVRVSTDQPLGDLAILLLDAESEDSFLSWGFFPEIFQATEYIEAYALEPLAQSMLASDPNLKRAFEDKLAAEPAFAADGDARLQWFYERSPYRDQTYLLYPIGRED